MQCWRNSSLQVLQQQRSLLLSGGGGVLAPPLRIASCRSMQAPSAGVAAAASGAPSVAMGSKRSFANSSSSRNVTMRAKRSGSSATQPRQVPVVEKLEWQAPLSVIKYPDPRLRAVNAKIGVFDDSLKQLAGQMFDIMYQDDGVGLAAPQVGVNVRLMVFNETAERGNPAETVLVNPEIIEKGRATDIDEEGCLSFPKLYADVERSTKIEVRYQDLQGQQQEMQLSGFVARIFQHEYDHLQGVLYHDRMKQSEVDKIRQGLLDLEEAFIAANPGVKVQRLGAPKKAATKGFGGAARR